ncbi:hypothetical protein [Epilithonimonas sp.]|uniref:hypothetical protein n=1 Tax=Epilithonimonas sp. TaxID=2894511 RepID=UPI0035B402D9
MKEQIKSEYLKLIESNYSNLSEYFKDNLYHFSALTSLRNEILQCLLLKLYQSSIFATNHFLERMIKLALINKHTINLNYSNLNLYNEKTKEAIILYDNLNLNESLKLAKQENLINDRELENLKDFKNKIRNPYSHAEIKKIIDKAPQNFKGYMFNIDEIKESLKKGETIEIREKKEITKFSSSISQFYQEKFSVAIAEYYFKEVYEILKNIENRLNQIK